jgi:hypothetical protein
VISEVPVLSSGSVYVVLRLVPRKLLLAEQ